MSQTWTPKQLEYMLHEKRLLWLKFKEIGKDNRKFLAYWRNDKRDDFFVIHRGIPDSFSLETGYTKEDVTYTIAKSFETINAVCLMVGISLLSGNGTYDCLIKLCKNTVKNGGASLVK